MTVTYNRTCNPKSKREPMKIMRVVLPLVVAALVLAGAVPVSEAQTRSLYWERFDVDITVLQNGDLRVEETQVIRFTSGVFREGFAELSTHNTDGITDITVNENGTPYERRASTSGLAEGTYGVDRLDSGNIEVVWNMGRTENQTRTFVLGYTVRGAIRRYPEGNEFQWNAISPGLRDFEVRESTVAVHMPPGAAITYADYLVPPEFSGVPMNVQVSADGLTATWVALERLPPSRGIQIVVQFPPGTVGGNPPTWQAAFDMQSAWQERYKPWVDLGLLALGLLILVGGPALLFVLWYVRGRDPVIEAVPEHITEPPSGVPPGIAGTLVDEKADVADVIATLMDLAERGFIVIEESTSSTPFRLGGTQFTLRKTDMPANERDFNPMERQLYNALFRGRDQVSFSQLNQRFYTNMPKLQNKLYDTAVERGYFAASPASVRSRYGCLGQLLLGAAVVIGFVAMSMFSGWTSTLLCPFMAAGLVGIILAWLGQHMPVKTRKGAEAAALSRAFKNYLSNLERYADPQTVTDQFAKYLPYAIAFGLDRSWINRFKRIPATPIPGWYYPVGRPYTPGVPRRTSTQTAGGAPGTARPPGPGAPQAPAMPTLQSASDALSGGLQSISDGLNSMLNSAARTMTSTPPSSSSSTSSGGRSFSGGGGSFRSSGGSGGGGRGFR
jgi:uncharacterized membrane protein YgcG